MTTQHSTMRAKERLGINSKTWEHVARNALERGKDKTLITDKRLREWLISKEQVAGCRALIYNQFCYIVSPSDAIITEYPVPGWLIKGKKYDGKKQVRDSIKYSKYNLSYDDYVM